MKFARPELAHQFRVRLHARARALAEEYDRRTARAGLPEAIITSISRDADFYEDGRFSWHLVDCAVDLRNRHYRGSQRAKAEGILQDLVAKDPDARRFELITYDHGTGPHFHLAFRVQALRQRWEAEQAHRSALVERLADLEHRRWSGWMEYLFTRGQLQPDGSFNIAPSFVTHWKRQLATPYADLSEQEKESDRIEARKTLAVLAQEKTQ